MLTTLVRNLIAPRTTAYAHCDLPCGVYDPAQARIEAESIKAIIAKVADNDDADFRTRANPHRRVLRPRPGTDIGAEATRSSVPRAPGT